MRITILTIGSQGDIQPCIALGRGLQRQGHEVTIATYPNFQSLAIAHKLDFSPINVDIQEMLSGEKGQQLVESGTNPFHLIREFRQLYEPVMSRILADSWQSCQKAEAIIASSVPAYWGYEIAQQLNIPFYFTSPFPVTPNWDFPIPSSPPLNLGNFYNRLTYPVIKLLFWQVFRRSVNQWRESVFGLKPLSVFHDPWSYMEKEGVPFLYSYSSLVLLKPKTWSEQICVTGYWELDDPDFTPPSQLVDFLASGSPPVYIGFGSMTGIDPEQLTKIALQALVKSGQRGILATGWGGLSATELPDGVIQIQQCPHNWLFPQMAAVVHHGGAGTTGASLKAGVPSIIVPFFGDQPFWGQRVNQLGVGPAPIPREQLTTERLAGAIQATVRDREIQSSATRLGHQLQQENGVARAIEAFHNYLP